MDTYNLGTIELLVVDLTDRIGTVTDLAAYDVDYKITDESEAVVKVDWTPVNSKTGMRVFPLLDTSAGWDEGTYKLYIRPTISPEMPILGPLEFGLS